MKYSRKEGRNKQTKTEKRTTKLSRKRNEGTNGKSGAVS
jgi:hypothetical protein